jgi:hypothetical protein
MRNKIEGTLKWSIREIKYRYQLTVHLLTRLVIQDKTPVVRLDKEGLSPSYGRPICLFCSYDDGNVIRENVYYYLNQLMLAGFDTVFISSSDAISELDIERLTKCCVRIINRENKGYDFYGWKTGLEKYSRFKSHTGLLLANDSVLGPLFDMSDITKKLERCSADIIGMTNCRKFYPHLQSYFLYCKQDVVLSEEFLRFFREVKVYDFKNLVIRKYEVGFSRFFSSRFRLAALYDLDLLVDKLGYSERPIQRIEPTYHLWKSLITELKFPFLKKSLMTRRGICVEEISSIFAEIGSPYNLDTLTDWISPSHLTPRTNSSCASNKATTG